MTDEQFDEKCRNALAYEQDTVSGATWSRIRPARRNWLPTIPEIAACGCACGLALFLVAVRLSRPSFTTDSNPVIQRAIGESLAGVSALQVPDTTPWTEASLSLPSASGTFMRPGP